MVKWLQLAAPFRIFCPLPQLVHGVQRALLHGCALSVQRGLHIDEAFLKTGDGLSECFFRIK